MSNVASLTLSPEGEITLPSSTSFSGTGSLYITGTVAFPSSLTLKGVGAFIVTGTLTGGDPHPSGGGDVDPQRQ